MRALIFSTAYFPYVGGAEVAVQEITGRLADVDFVLLTARMHADLPAEEIVGRVKVYRVGSGSWLDKFRLAWAGPRLAASLGRFDLVWAIMASYGGLAATRYKKLHPETPYLLTLQEGDSERHIYLRAALIWPWFKSIFKRADSVQAISSYLARWGEKMGARCPVTVVPNAVAGLPFGFEFVDTENIRVVADATGRASYQKAKVEQAVAEVRQRMSLRPGDKLIVTVSRLVKKNGLADLIKAMNFLPQEYKLSIVGAGNLEKKLKSLVVKLGLSERVYFNGFVPNSDVWAHYAAADVFVRASLSEGLGNSFLEAMIMRKPVIGTPVGGIPDFLQDGVTGWFCQPGNPVSIAEKIMYVLDEKNLVVVERVKSNASQMIHDRFLWDKIAEQMKNIFVSLCAS